VLIVLRSCAHSCCCRKKRAIEGLFPTIFGGACESAYLWNNGLIGVWVDALLCMVVNLSLFHSLDYCVSVCAYFDLFLFLLLFLLHNPLSSFLHCQHKTNKRIMHVFVGRKIRYSKGLNLVSSSLHGHLTLAGGQSLLHVSLLEERSPIYFLSLCSGSCPTLNVKVESTHSLWVKICG
jgi:hypothetical protein